MEDTYAQVMALLFAKPVVLWLREYSVGSAGQRSCISRFRSIGIRAFARYAFS